MDWKPILKAAITPIILALYGVLTGNFPDFPLSGDGFLQTILWLIGIGVGGWQAKAFFLKIFKK